MIDLIENVWMFNLLTYLIFSSPEPKAQVSFSDQNLSIVSRCRRCRSRRCWCCRKLFTFSSSSSEPLGQFQPTWHKASLGKGAQVCSNERPSPFPRGYNY